MPADARSRASSPGEAPAGADCQNRLLTPCERCQMPAVARSRASSPGEAPAGADCQIVFVVFVSLFCCARGAGLNPVSCGAKLFYVATDVQWRLRVAFRAG